MRTLCFGAAIIVALGACTDAPERAAAPTLPGHIHFVLGNRYNKGFYDDGDETVIAFQLSVTNRGPDTGRAPDPECHTILRDVRYDLEIFENPELAPGERGWFRTGGAVSKIGPRAAENLEAYCDL